MHNQKEQSFPVLFKRWARSMPVIAQHPIECRYVITDYEISRLVFKALLGV